MWAKTASILLLGACLASAEPPAIPDTPVGRALQAWFDAFNSGERGRLQKYVAEHKGPQTADGWADFRQQTGGFELLGIDRSDPVSIEFRVKEKSGPTVAVAKMELKDAGSGEVKTFNIRAIPPGMTAADMSLKIDAAERTRVIDGAVAALKEFYIFPETAKKMEAAVRAHLAQGDYDSVTDADQFANVLTEHMREVSHDKHLRVNFSPRVLPVHEGGPSPEAEAQMRAQMERNNCAFQKVERLQPNIGYVKFNGFADPAVCGPTASAAMNFVGNVDAIIFDMRDNGGGDPAMVAYVSSYLFAEPTHLNDLYNRKEDSTSQFWTLPYVPGKRLAGKPAFVLTSKRTFSGAEEFSYNLKMLKRATIVGETTGGGAHPVSGHRIDDHFSIGVPFARAINPISKTNWEGTGVEPDVQCPADEALDVARKMAADAIKTGPPKK